MLAGWLTRHGFGFTHELIGYIALVIVLLRLAWGFGPSRYARFSQFLRSPAQTARYAGSVVRGVQPRYLGHNPLGGWMTVLLLATTTAVCVSGWLYTTDRYWGVEWVEDLHDGLTNLLLSLVLLHVLGVLWTSIHDRENLVAAMLHGRKRAPDSGEEG